MEPDAERKTDTPNASAPLAPPAEAKTEVPQEVKKAEEVTSPSVAPVAQPAQPTGVTNTSSAAGGLNGPFPAELNHWSWGAFFLSWIWAIGNQVWIGLLALLPIGPLPLIMCIVLGIKGNEWAWQYRKFESVEQFKAVQKAWATWGLILFLLGVLLIFGMIVLMIVLAQRSVVNNASGINGI